MPRYPTAQQVCIFCYITRPASIGIRGPMCLALGSYQLLVGQEGDEAAEPFADVRRVLTLLKRGRAPSSVGF
jgi:hypothetical protein